MTAQQRIDLFWSKVIKTDSCWLWTGAKNSKGYGRFSLKPGGRRFAAHRIAYSLSHPLTDAHTLDHLCRNHACVNPAHLEPVSAVENVMRGTGFAPINKGKTHCPKGHEYTPQNTLRRRSGSGHMARFCRECALATNRAYHAAYREEQNMKRKQRDLRSLGEE